MARGVKPPGPRISLAAKMSWPQGYRPPKSREFRWTGFLRPRNHFHGNSSLPAFSLTAARIKLYIGR